MYVTNDTKFEAQRILDYLEMNPHIHDQNGFWSVHDETGANLDDANVTDARLDPDPNICNTTMCIAGTQRWLARGIAGLAEWDEDLNIEPSHPTRRAADALGLSTQERSALFYCWDNAYALDMLRAIAAGDENKFKEVSVAYSKDSYTELSESWQNALDNSGSSVLD